MHLLHKQFRYVRRPEETRVCQLIHLAVVDIDGWMNDLHVGRHVCWDDMNRNPNLPHRRENGRVSACDPCYHGDLLADARGRKSPAEHGTAGRHTR